MKIAICGSMRFSPEMVEVKKELEKLGHAVTLPKFTEHYATLTSREDMHNQAAHNKNDHDLIKDNFEVVRENDAILVYNPPKEDINHYIGGNTFIEMAFAHVLNRKIFMYFPVPDMHYKDEIEAMKPIIIERDLTRILNE